MGKLNDKFLRRTENFVKQSALPPQITNNMYKSVSLERRALLENEVERGIFRDGNAPVADKNGLTSASLITSTGSFNKKAEIISSQNTSSGWRGGNGDALRQTPEVYSPLWLNSNLNLPRDRATINAWCRSFYALAPFVQNAINLHSTYPISKLNIKCPNKKVERFFNDMIEEIDLMNVCVQVAQEFWLLGEAFIYAELDQRNAKWARLVIQNPDYVVVKRSVIASEPLIMLRPDENLRRIVFSNRPSDIEQKNQLNETIIEHVKRGENIPLDNFYVSHLARRISPYEVRGTGLPVCCFRQLMLLDKIRECKFAQADDLINPLTIVKIGSQDYKPTHADLEVWRNEFACHDEETEVLTQDGFKKFNEVMEYFEKIDGTYNVVPKNDIKIACFNPNNEQLEYYNPSSASLYNYEGNMYHFKNEKIDIRVTPNHKMWACEKEHKYNLGKKTTNWSNWKKIEAKDLKLTDYKRFRSKINWVGNDNIKQVDVCGKKVAIELYLEFLGYLLSEGSCWSSGKHQKITTISQSFGKYQAEMALCFDNFAKAIDKSYSVSINKRSEKNSKHYDMWAGKICSKELLNYFKNEIGTDNNTRAQFKKIPRWILDLSPRLLNILLTAMVKGDGSINKRKDPAKNGFVYHTTSKELADGVYEMVYKTGLVPTVYCDNRDEYTKRPDHNRLPLYRVMWSNCGKGDFPQIYKTSRNSLTKEKHNLLEIEKYNGKVWCFEVPTGLFITRRNGKITIQSNSATYDKNFKIFTHEGVSVERVGANSAIYDTSGDITQLLKEIYIGLMAPQVLMDGGGDITYQNGGISLDVLRQRYMQFRNMMTAWLRKKIFAPISKLNEFYEYEDGEKKLIIPDVDWNHMSLFDTSDFVNVLVQLSGEQKKLSQQTLYKSLGLEYDEERRKIKKEDISDMIRKKELMSLERMSLNELRALSEEDEIPEITEAPLAGQSPYSQPDASGAAGGLPPLPGMPGGDMGGMGSLPPPPPMPSGPPPGGPPKI